uniref:Uncharacterized protein n=1 Tax=Ditylenchus dipsaci TaxID=166011 RepID=A0A915EJS4_9BILA
MCQSLVEQQKQKAVEMYLLQWDKMDLNLKPEEWTIVRKLVTLLDPLESASKQICRADEPLSIQFPIARSLTRNINDVTVPELQQICGSILGHLCEKFNVEYEK